MYPHLKTRFSPDQMELDPIDVAGSVIMQEAIPILRKWNGEYAAVLDGSHEIWRTHPEAPQEIIRTSKAFCSQLKQLEQWGVLRRSQTRARCYIGYFTVPKTSGKARAIANCKAMNKFFHADWPFCLATIEELFRVITFFPPRNGVFGVLDLRHWFHQLSLPRQAEGLFRLTVGSETWDWCTWPMGFKYTPVIAQAVVGAIIAETIVACGWLMEGSIPAEAVIRGRSKRHVCVVAAVWYDNIIVHCAHQEAHHSFFTRLHSIMSRLKVKIKEPGVTTSKTQVQYLGIVATNQATRCVWRHIADNVSRWLKIKIKPKMSGHEVYAALGVLLWHIRLRGLPFGRVRESFRKIYEQTLHCNAEQDWTLMCSLSVDNQATLRQWLKEATEDREFDREITSPPLHFRTTATDASNWGWAFVDRGGIKGQAPWTDVQKEWHINTKEAYAAIQAVYFYAKSRTHILVAVDNQVAKSWLSETWDLTRQEGRWVAELNLHLQELEATMEIIYVKSEENPADSASRGDRSFQEDKQWWSALQAKAEKPLWFQEARQGKRSRWEIEQD